MAATKEEQNAADALLDLFRSYGLDSLGPKILEFVQEYGPENTNTIVLQLQQTTEYKQRFRGNEARKKAGLPVLSPAEYLAQEQAYRQVLRGAGLPAGFYDSPDDFHRFLERDVSPAELAQRAQASVDLALSVDPVQRETLAMYGIDVGSLAAYFLDPDRAYPVMVTRYEQSLLAAEKRRAGYEIAEDDIGGWVKQLHAAGVSAERAREGYGRITETFDTDAKLGEIWGDKYTLRDAEKGEFLADGTARRKRRRLASRERAAFSGSSGASGASLRRDDRFN